MEMSDAAMQALVNVGTNRQGAAVSTYTSDRAVKELQALGLIGTGRGLTRAGTIERERIMSINLDEMFG